MIDRRRAKRFRVDWPIRVEGADDGAASFIVPGVLRNISSVGALLSLRKPLSAGTKIDVYIKLPLRGKRWMKYPASVVRVEADIASAVTAVRFNSARPDFGSQIIPS
ncbi:MAG: PilZ domain-containing protein [Blastocatellia bacterium]